MLRVILTILHAFATHTQAEELTANRKNVAQDSMDKLTDPLIHKLVNILLGSQFGISQRARPMFSSHSSPVARVNAMQDYLRTYGADSRPLTKFALTAIDINNRGNRDLSVTAAKVQQGEIVSGWSTVDKDTKRKLVKVLGQVEAKESILAGISSPMGFFDPLGFSTTVTGGKLLFYREVELKHGRIAMLASLGMLVEENFHPLFGGDIDVPGYIAFQQTPLEAFWPAVIAAIAIPEMFSVFQFQDPTEGAEYWTMRADHEPGDLGFDPLGLKPKNAQEYKIMQSKELNNGRLAMIAAAGMLAQEYATGAKLF